MEDAEGVADGRDHRRTAVPDRDDDPRAVRLLPAHVGIDEVGHRPQLGDHLVTKDGIEAPAGGDEREQANDAHANLDDGPGSAASVARTASSSAEIAREICNATATFGMAATGPGSYRCDWLHRPYVPRGLATADLRARPGSQSRRPGSSILQSPSDRGATMNSDETLQAPAKDRVPVRPDDRDASDVIEGDIGEARLKEPSDDSGGADLRTPAARRRRAGQADRGQRGGRPGEASCRRDDGRGPKRTAGPIRHMNEQPLGLAQRLFLVVPRAPRGCGYSAKRRGP